MSILRLEPAYKDFMWGGSVLKKEYGKSNYPGYVLAETWELSADPDSPARITNGEYRGVTFDKFVKENGAKALGTNFDESKEFPITVKFIDAHQNLSIKLHPSDTYADQHNLIKGNDECWYIMKALPNAGIFYGLERDLSKAEFEQRIRNNTLKDVIHFQVVKPGEVYFSGPGLLHSIGAGVVAAEVKQAKQVKYRVYDYGRVQPDGTPRPLSIEEAVEAANLKAGAPQYNFKPHLVDCSKFILDEIEIEGEVTLSTDGTSFHHLLFLDGDGVLISSGSDSRMEYVKGSSIVVTADHGEYRLKGRGLALLTSIKKM